MIARTILGMYLRVGRPLSCHMLLAEINNSYVSRLLDMPSTHLIDSCNPCPVILVTSSQHGHLVQFQILVVAASNFHSSSELHRLPQG